ncbi:elongation factor Ts [Lacticaseibacillus rhamnosus MTCC 5462]|nr:elongation factor Ts [Lacticaseibacillus rhamnosus MTCC 5462]
MDGADDATAKDVAMHVAAINPEYLDRSKVPADELQHQTDIFTEETKTKASRKKLFRGSLKVALTSG